MRWLRRDKNPGAAGSLDDTMAGAANAFVKMARQLGWEFDYGLDSARMLDSFIGRLVETGDPINDAVVTVMGAYFGETARTVFGGAWELSSDPQDPRLTTAGGASLRPFSEIRHRIDDRTDGSLPNAIDSLYRPPANAAALQAPESMDLGELATYMAGLAELFVDLASKVGGVALDYSEGSVASLDPWVDGLWDPKGPKPSEAQLDSNTKLIGAYLGEVMIRTIGGRWVWSLDPKQPAVERSGKTALVLNRAFKRQVNGPDDSLADFYEAYRRLP